MSNQCRNLFIRYISSIDSRNLLFFELFFPLETKFVPKTVLEYEFSCFIRTQQPSHIPNIHINSNFAHGPEELRLNANNNNGRNAIRVCFDYQRGACVRGAMCKYPHIMRDELLKKMNGGGTSAAPQTPQPTFDGARFRGNCVDWDKETGVGHIKPDLNGEDDESTNDEKKGEDGESLLVVHAEDVKCVDCEKDEKGRAILVVGNRYEYSVEDESDEKEEESDKEKRAINVVGVRDSTQGTKRSLDGGSSRIPDAKRARIMPQMGGMGNFGMGMGMGMMNPMMMNMMPGMQNMMGMNMMGMNMMPGMQNMMSGGMQNMMGNQNTGTINSSTSKEEEDNDTAKGSESGLLLEDECKLIHSKYPCAVQVEHLHGPTSLFGEKISKIPNVTFQIKQRMKLSRGKWLPKIEDRVLLYFSAVHNSANAKVLKQLADHLKDYKGGRAGVVNFRDRGNCKLHLIPPGKFQQEILKESLPDLEPLDYFLVIGKK